MVVDNLTEDQILTIASLTASEEDEYLNMNELVYSIREAYGLVYCSLLEDGIFSTSCKQLFKKLKDIFGSRSEQL